MSQQQSIQIGSTLLEPGSITSLHLPLPRLYTRSEITMPVRVVHGRHSGPRLLVCAALHGDELNGIDIIRRVLEYRDLRRVRGTLIAVPVVNVYGLINGTRYLPDGRDLNRSFPGSRRGSLAARLARFVLDELVKDTTHVVDLHTGALHRPNLPQVRARLEDETSQAMARAFGAPMILDAALRAGSLRGTLAKRGIASIVYETGEALCLDEAGIRIGFQGVISVMRELGMLPQRTRKPRPKPYLASESSWIRAPMSGVFRTQCRLGDAVSKNQALGSISDPLGDHYEEVRAPAAGVIIGQLNQALVYQGNALLHLAQFKTPRAVAERVQTVLETDAARSQNPQGKPLSQP